MNIERKYGAIPVPYLFVNEQFYSTLSDYSPNNTYLELATEDIPPSWVRNRSGSWWNFRPKQKKLPSCGFKIHISSSLDNAKDILKFVTKLAVSRGITYKFLLDDVVHNLANSKNYSSWSCGKFITLFPVDKVEFTELLEILSRLIPSTNAPYIYSDLNAANSHSVFYRYGSFVPAEVVNIYGEYERSIYVNGQLLVDNATPIFSLPIGLEDPALSLNTSRLERKISDEEVELNNRYAISGVLHRSNSGAVLSAIDCRTNNTVVIKEAKYGITTSKVQSSELLKREYKILELLSDTGVTPIPIEVFQTSTSYFLVMEYIDAVPVSKFRSSPIFTSLHTISPSKQDINRAQRVLNEVWSNLNEALQLVHQCDVILGDIAPQNILIDPDTNRVWFIDFESARYKGDCLNLNVYTIGYQDKQNIVITKDANKKSLSRVMSNLILPIQAGLPLNPELNTKLLTRFENHYPQLKTTLNRIDPDFSVNRNSLSRNHFNASHLRDEILLNIKENIGAAASGYLWACDYRGLNTNPLSIAYGALGIAPALLQIEGDISNEIHDWITEALKVERNYAPGLFIGSAGIALGLSEIGRVKEAELWMKRATSSELINENIDFFFGNSGVGIALIHLYSISGKEEYLAQAIGIAENLLNSEARNIRYSKFNLDYNGIGHGHAGIALFFLSLFKVTHDKRYLTFAELTFKAEIERSLPNDDDVLQWTGGNHDNRQMPYFRIGSAGIGSVGCRLFEVTNNQTYLEQSLSIAKGCSLRYSGHPGLLTGMTGIGEFFLDLQNISQDTDFSEQIDEIIANITMFLFNNGNGLASPSESLTRTTFDYGTGSSGIALFFHRLINPTIPRRLLDIVK